MRVALSLARSMIGGTRWRMVVGLLTAARETGETPMLRAFRVDGAGWVLMSFWGVRFRPDTLAELKAEPAFAVARGRGEVAELVSPSSPEATAPAWLIALASPARPPAYLPPCVAAVEVPFKNGGYGRYTFETLVYPLASR